MNNDINQTKMTLLETFYVSGFMENFKEEGMYTFGNFKRDFEGYYDNLLLKERKESNLKGDLFDKNNFRLLELKKELNRINNFESEHQLIKDTDRTCFKDYILNEIEKCSKQTKDNDFKPKKNKAKLAKEQTLESVLGQEKFDRLIKYLKEKKKNLDSLQACITKNTDGSYSWNKNDFNSKEVSSLIHCLQKEKYFIDSYSAPQLRSIFINTFGVTFGVDTFKSNTIQYPIAKELFNDLPKLT